MRRSFRVPILAGFAALAGLCVGVPRGLEAQTRLVERIGAAQGLLAGAVRSLAEDSSGFLWFGSVGGLHRWDGVQLRRWAPDEIRGWVNFLVTCPNGRLFAVEEPGRLWEVEEGGVERVAPPTTDLATGPVTIACDAANRLWVANWERVWRRDPRNGWTEVLPGKLLGEIPEVLRDETLDGVWLHTRSALWLVDSAGHGRIVARIHRPVAVVRSSAGDTLVLSRAGSLWRLHGGTPVEVYHLRARGIDLVRRGRAVYAAYDRYLVRVADGTRPMVAGPDEIAEGAGPLLVDHEGSLWIGTVNGVLHFPEPETLLWTDRHGLPSAYALHLARAGDRMWVTTWQGTGYVDGTGGAWRAATAPQWFSATPMVVDSRGVLWMATPAALIELRNGRLLARHPWHGIAHHESILAPGGGVWVGSEQGIATVRPGAGGVDDSDLVPSPTGGPVMRLLRTRAGVVWVVGRTNVCHSDGPFATWDAARWRCEEVPGAVELSGIVELADETVWLSSSRTGVYARSARGWAPLPGNRDLPSRAVLGLEPSPSGGVWVYGHGMALRVQPDRSLPAGWRVLESVTAWQGVPVNQFADVLEEHDGTLWLATGLGVARVPAAARSIPATPPRVALVEARVDTTVVSTAATPDLPFRHHQVEVRFAALSYRAPALLRYQVRLYPSTVWTDVRGEPTFRWIDLGRGHYRAEVRASLNGIDWSPHPAAFVFSVRGPWYLTPHVLALAAAVLLAAAILTYRARVRVLLQMERQRARVAMDLHDELGSGLGAIGILGGVLAEGRADPAKRVRLAREVMAISQELGTGLSDIVWSLDPREGTLAELASRLREHGTRLFSGGATTFQVRFPEAWPALSLGARARRSLLLVGLEALHNVARHAGAARVTLTIAVSADEVALTVEDDGAGVPRPEAHTGDGRGLASMARRAADIGAILEVAPRPQRGTRVHLTVPRRALARP